MLNLREELAHRKRSYRLRVEEILASIADPDVREQVRDVCADPNLSARGVSAVLRSHGWIVSPTAIGVYRERCT